MLSMPRGKHVMLPALAAAVLASAALIAIVSTSTGPSALLQDPDAPTSSEIEYAKKFRRTTALSQSSERQQNARLRSKVHRLEREVRTLSSDLTGGSPRTMTSLASSGNSRMQWAQAAMKHPTRVMHRMQSLATHINPSSGSPWYKIQSNGPRTEALTTEAGDDNPLAKVTPSDYWKDPYERPFLHAPGPHDPSSSLAKTVTGDYASPATWGDIYHSKETIDWCVEQFPWITDRMKCIRKLHKSGPLLG
mmetsp:Transcript_27780/g.43375  ORF Transcript_27780/g.43375 Transcript_27780/m.43375 type:complete len:249 (+) Transcript_27780:2-748(+)